MRRRRAGLAGLLSVVAVLALVVGGCSSSPRTSQPSGISTTTLPPAAIKLENGGTVTVGVPYLPTNFNPSSAAGANRVTDMVMAQVWPQSFVIDPQFQPETTGFVDDAELVSLSPETISYHIDPGARWSDGVPITAADFVYNWHQQLQHAGSAPLAGSLLGYSDIASITASGGGKTVTVVFKSTFADWEGLFQNLVPAHVAERVGWDGFVVGSLSDVVSGGPFEIASYVPGQTLTLRRNPRWWGTPAHLESIVFRVVSGGSAGNWSAITSTRIDVGEVLPDAGAGLRAAEAGVNSATTLSPVLWQLCFNVTDALMGEPSIRSAIAEATDRTELVADTIGLDDPGIPVAENRVYLVDEPGWSDDAGQYSSVDVLGAQSLLTAAGYRMSPTGYVARSAEPLVITLTAPSDFPLTAPLEALFEAQMKDVGIVVRFRNVPLAQLLTDVLPTSQFQLALVPFIGAPFESWTQTLYNPPGLVPAGGGTSGAGPTGVTGGVGPTGVTGGGGAIGPAGGGGAGGAGGAAAVGAAGRQAADVNAAGASGSGLLLGGRATDAATRSVRGQPVAPGVVASDVSGLSDPAVANLYAKAEAEIDPPTARRLYDEIDGLLWEDLPTIPLFQMPVTLLTAHDLVNVQESPTPVGFMWNAQDWAIALNLPAPTTSVG